MVAANASADESDAYCDKVVARAHADAALLFSPALTVQGVKLPSSSPTDPTSQTATNPNGYQFQTLMVWSPLKAYQGVGTLDVGETDCFQHKNVVHAMYVLNQLSDVGRLQALTKEIEYLEGKQTIVSNILSNTEERLAANVATVSDTLIVRQRALGLERKRVEARGQLNVLISKDAPKTTKDIVALSDAIETSSMGFERATNHVRSLDPWLFDITGGIIPPTSGIGTQWFGVIAVGYNFGGFSRLHQDNRYLDARLHELKTARYELRDQLSKFRANTLATMNSANVEIAVIEIELARLAVIRDRLLPTDATNTQTVINAIDLQVIDIEADKVFLQELVVQLTTWNKGVQ